VFLEIDYSIGRIERETGISKDLLRVWERRYGFPLPQRSESGERFYAAQDLKKLLLIKRLMDMGHRPGQLMTLTTDQLTVMLDAPKALTKTSYDDDITDFMTYIHQNQFDSLSQHIDYWLMRYGVEAFLLGLLPRFMAYLGNQWQVGALSIYQEHIVSEMLQTKLRQSFAFLPPDSNAPTVFLTTLPEEQHGLGLLVCDILLKLEGVKSINAGIQMPVGAIAQAVYENHADVLCLSLSSLADITDCTKQINELLTQLSPSVSVLLGGQGSHNIRIRDDRVRVLSDTQTLISEIKKLVRNHVK